MSNNTGTLIISPIRPYSNSDIFPVAFANEIRGGIHQVQNDAQRLNISSERLVEGMLCTVIDTMITWQYSGGSWIEMNFEFLSNLNISNPSNNQVLTYDQLSGKWVNRTYLGLYETGETILNKSGITTFVVGNKNLDRGINIDYTLSRTGSSQYQIGRIDIIHDDINVKISDEYLSTMNTTIAHFNAIYNGFLNDNISLECDVSPNIDDVVIKYHIKKFNF